MTSSLRLRRVLLSLRRRIRCDHNQRNRGFLVVATTRGSRVHIRTTAAPAAQAVRRPCSAPRSSVRALAPRGQS